MDESKTFLGRGWRFPPEFHADLRSPGGERALQAAMAAEEDDVREAIIILLSTVPGERIMHPTFGCGLKNLVFETLNEAVTTQIKDVIDRAILFHEHRVILDNIEVTFDELDGRMDIELDYTIRTTNSRANMVYPFYVLEGTDIRTAQ